jgi:diaminopimelate decarboxylase
VPTVRSYSERELHLSQRYFIEPSAPDPAATLSPEQYATQVTSTIADFFADRKKAVPKIVIEPGRSLTGNTQLLLCSVFTTKASDNFTYAVLDAGISIADVMKGEFHQMFPLITTHGPKQTYRLVGPICHTGDTICNAWSFPKLNEGDGIAIMDSGAYFIPDSRSFSFPRPGIIGLHADGSEVLLRHHESFEHLVSLDRYPVRLLDDTGN